MADTSEKRCTPTVHYVAGGAAHCQCGQVGHPADAFVAGTIADPTPETRAQQAERLNATISDVATGERNDVYVPWPDFAAELLAAEQRGAREALERVKKKAMHELRVLMFIEAELAALGKTET